MSKKSLTLIGLVTVSQLLSPSVSQAEEEGFYAEAQLGYVNSHLSTKQLITLYHDQQAITLPAIHPYSLAYRLAFGYQLNPHLSFESGYRRFQATQIQAAKNNDYSLNTSQHLHAFDVLAKFSLAVTRSLSINGKCGVALVWPHIRTISTTQAPYRSTNPAYKNRLAPAFALGFSYALKPNVPLTFSWNRIQALGQRHQLPSSDFYALGTAYYFG